MFKNYFAICGLNYHKNIANFLKKKPCDLNDLLKNEIMNFICKHEIEQIYVEYKISNSIINGRIDAIFVSSNNKVVHIVDWKYTIHKIKKNKSNSYNKYFTMKTKFDQSKLQLSMYKYLLQNDENFINKNIKLHIGNICDNTLTFITCKSLTTQNIRRYLKKYILKTRMSTIYLFSI